MLRITLQKYLNKPIQCNREFTKQQWTKLFCSMNSLDKQEFLGHMNNYETIEINENNGNYFICLVENRNDRIPINTISVKKCYKIGNFNLI